MFNFELKEFRTTVLHIIYFTYYFKILYDVTLNNKNYTEFFKI